MIVHDVQHKIKPTKGPSVLSAVRLWLGRFYGSHDDNGCHLGFRKTLARIMQSFYWAGIHTSVYDYIKACVMPTKQNESVAPNGDFATHLSGCPWQNVWLDIAGPLPQSPDIICISW